MKYDRNTSETEFPSLTILIVSWNSRNELFQCLDSIKHLQQLPVKIETIVVDNASQDGTAELLRKSEQDLSSMGAKVIFNKSNLGLSLATEQAYRVARGDRILLCNPDVLLNNSLTEMIDYSLAHPDQILTAKLLNIDGSVQKTSHRRFPSVTRLFFGFGVVGSYLDRTVMRDVVHHNYCYKMEDFRKLPARVDQPAATILMLGRESISRIGGIFSSEFPVWWNDVDLAKRAEHAGIPRVVLPNVQFRHHLGASQRHLPSAILRNMFVRGMMGFAKKWRVHPVIMRWLFVADAVFGVPLILFLRKGGDGLGHTLPGTIRDAAFQVAGVLTSL